MDVSIPPSSGQRQPPVAYEFGAFRLEPSEQRLIYDGKPLPLPHRAFELLVFLVERSGHLVTKEELLASLWPGLFVEESNLTQNVFMLRRALTNGANGHAYIETIPRSGYRFTAPVRPVFPGPAATTSTALLSTDAARAPASAEPVRLTEAAPAAKRRAGPMLGLFAAVLVVGLAAAWLLRGRAAPSNALGVRSIAVLPFRALDPTAESEYLGLGIADAVITRLGYARTVSVRPTSAVRSLPSLTDPVAAGRALSVDAVLEGTIQEAGNRIRVTVQLVGVPSGVPLWSDKFDLPRTDLFGLEDSISEALAADLSPGSGGSEREQLRQRRGTTAQAYEAYLKGRFYWNRRTQDSFRRAVGLFEQAIAADADYAPAHAGLADCWNFLGEAPRARQEARRALQLDPSLSDAHAALGNTSLFYDYDFPVAEREFRRSIQLNPSYATAHQWYAYGLVSQRRFDEALAEIRTAREIDPLSLSIATDVGDLLYYARRYDEAERECRKALEIDPHFLQARLILATVLFVKGEVQAAASELSALGPGEITGAIRAEALVRSGRREEARQILESLADPAPSNPCYWPWFRADMSAALGESGEALEWLERARLNHCGQLIMLGVDPRFDPLRSDPRFTELLRKIGIPS